MQLPIEGLAFSREPFDTLPPQHIERIGRASETRDIWFGADSLSRVARPGVGSRSVMRPYSLSRLASRDSLFGIHHL